MFRVRLNPFSSTEETFKIKEGGENLEAMVTSYLCHKGFSQEQYKHFVILWKGEEIPFDMAKDIQVASGEEVLVAPRVSGGEFGQTFKMAAVIAITIAAGILMPGVGAAGATGVFAALGVAAISIGASLALNALIPPLDTGTGNLGGYSNSIDSSQMYSISGQSNQAKPYSVIPKVYGTYRIYPNVAAQPYTDIEVDASTGDLVQVLYAVYDFGIGPMLVSDLKIGDTSISDFADLEYRYVDPNRPTTSEGYWDDQVNTSFTIYKGDVEVSEDSYALNLNASGYNPGTSVDDYRVSRTGAENVLGYESEIIVSGVFPKGVGAYDASGIFQPIEVDFSLEFSLVDENIWKGWNDLAYVSKFDASKGAYSTGDLTYVDLLGYQLVGFFPDAYAQIGDTIVDVEYRTFPLNGTLYPVSVTTTNMGFKVGTTKITTIQSIAVGKEVVIDGQYLGKVSSVTPNAILNPAYDIVFSEPIQTDIIIYTSVQGQYEQYPTVTGNTENRVSYAANTIGKYSIKTSNTTPHYTSMRFTPRVNGQYKVRVTRNKTLGTTGSINILDDYSHLSITTRFNKPVVNTTNRHSFLEIKIRATNQLSGSLDSLSGLVQGVLPVYDGTTWNLEATSNPAWVFADILTGPVNKKAVSKDRLHLPSLMEWANYADEIPTTPPGFDEFVLPRFTCNFILDYSTTVKDALDAVGSSAQATVNIIDGQYGVLLDVKRDTPVQVFTPRNYTGFSSARIYTDVVEGIKVKYNSSQDNWELAERLVYVEGYNKDNITTELEEIQSFGITNFEQAWRFGRYMLSQATLRQETISITVDFEAMVCTRGDFVQITQDSMKAGGRPARVKTVVGNQVTIDDAIETDSGLSYGYVARSVSGIVTDTLTVVSSDTFDLDGTIPLVGDLIVIGEVGNIVFDCIVKSVTPSDENTATLTLVEKADGVYESMETGTVSPYDPRLTGASSTTLSAPGEVSELTLVDNYSEVGEGKFNYFIDLTWQPPTTGGTYDSFEIYVNSGAGYNYTTNTSETSYTYSVKTAAVGVEHKFKILAVGAGGSKLNLGEVGFVSATPERKSTPPADVASLSIDITNQVLQLSWDLLPTSEGVLEYLVRYSPTLGDNWFTSIPLTKTDSNTSSTSVQARKGTYLIKAIDFEGNESANEALAITSIPALFDLNIIEETNDFPLLEGSFANVEKLGSSQLILQQENPGQYYSEGYYYFKEFLDLGAIYTVRLQSLVRAAGYTEGNLMTNWVNLSSVSPLSSSTVADWDVQTEVRYTNKRTVMGNWSPLSDVSSMTEGDIDDWNEWQSFVMGDFTGRTFQFRLKLISNLPSVSPKIVDGIIRADMPDRTESQDNITSNVLGSTVTYSVPFKGPSTTPSIQITQDNAQQGDYYTISNKTLSGFDIVFYDKTDVAVVRTFDVAVAGFGYENDEVI